MSNRVLFEFNTDFYQEWPEAIQDMIDDVQPTKGSWGRHGIHKKWGRHHTDPCPVEFYADQKGFEGVKRT